MALLKQSWINIIIIIIKIIAFVVIMILFSLILGFDLAVILPFWVFSSLYFLSKIISKKYYTQIRLISCILLVFFAILSKPILHHFFIKNSYKVCGTLTIRENHFFSRSLFHTPNIIVVIKDTEIKVFQLSFRGKVYDIPENSQVCVNYIEGDNTIWFYDDYALDIKEIKN